MNIYKKTNVFCPHCGSELELNENVYTTVIDGTTPEDEDYYEDVDYYWECPKHCDLEISFEDKEKDISRIVSERLNVFMV